MSDYIIKFYLNNEEKTKTLSDFMSILLKNKTQYIYTNITDNMLNVLKISDDDKNIIKKELLNQLEKDILYIKNYDKSNLEKYKSELIIFLNNSNFFQINDKEKFLNEIEVPNFLINEIIKIFKITTK